MADSNAIHLSIVIPNYNGEKLIPKFMPSVIEAANNYHPKTEIIIVDDASPDNSIAEIRKFDQVILVSRSENGGFPKACNSGLSRAKGKFIFLLNTDVELEPDFFHHYEIHFSRPDTFAVTAHGIHYQTGERMDGAKLGEWKRGNIRVTRNLFPEDNRNPEPPYPSFGVQGAYFFMDRAKLMELGGGLDEIYSPFIFEETDLGYRAMKRGWKIFYEPKLIAKHDHSTTINSVAKKRTIRTISERNRLLFTWANIHSPKLLLSHFIFLFLRLLTLSRAHWSGTYQAIQLLPAVLEKRKKELRNSKVKDEELIAGIQAYYNF